MTRPPDGAAPLRQAGPTACGPAVLLMTAALVSGTRPATRRFGAAQRRAHRQANRLWPRSLGTTPFGMRAWLHRHAPGAGRYRIRWTCGAAPPTVRDAVTAAAAAGRPVPLLVGSRIPRHWVLVTGVLADGGWQVYEPSSGEVRALPPAALRTGDAARTLAWPRLHAVLLPARGRTRRRAPARRRRASRDRAGSAWPAQSGRDLRGGAAVGSRRNRRLGM